MGFVGAKVVACTDHICSVGVKCRIEVPEKRKHLGGMPSASENDEEVGGMAPFTGSRSGWIGPGKNVEESELWRGFESCVDMRKSDVIDLQRRWQVA